MRYSGIGGQAVMEGVMMRNGDKYAVAVRKPDHEIEVDVKDYKGPSNSSVWKKLPLVRGVVNFIDSLVLGMSTLMYSASFFEDEEEEEAADKKQGKTKKDKSAEEATVFVANKSEPEEEVVTENNGVNIESQAEITTGQTSEKSEADHEQTESAKIEKQKPVKTEAEIQKQEKQEKAMMTGVVVISIVMAVLIFMILPYYLSTIFSKITDSQTIISILEGAIRLAIFIVYILLISQMKDIQRVFMYHGAEHKCINCIEHGLELNVENVRKSSKEHKRCGTSFLMFVVIISIILFLFIRVDSHALRLLIRVLLIPVIAGISYEILRLAGRSDNVIVNVLSKPGMWMQHLTTKEPDDEMIEVGIASVEAVFDWKKYQDEIRAEEPDAFAEGATS